MSEKRPSDTASFSFQPPPGGDISLKSSNGAVFVVHSAFLGLASPVFAGMFSAATQRDVIELSDDPESVSLMLRFIYPPAFLNDLPTVLLEKSLHMAQKYKIEGIRSTLDYIISQSFSQKGRLRFDPMRTFTLAISYGLRETQKATAKFIHLGRLRVPKDVETLAEKLPNHASVIGVLGAHCVRIQDLLDLLLDPDESWIMPMTEGPSRLESGLLMCKKCFDKAGYLHEPEVHYLPSWFYPWSVMVIRNLTTNPLDECGHVFKASSLDELGAIEHICHACVASAQNAGNGAAFEDWARVVQLTVEELFAKSELLNGL